MLRFKTVLPFLLVFIFLSCSRNSEKPIELIDSCHLSSENKLTSPSRIDLYRMMDYISVAGITADIEAHSNIDGFVLNQAQFLEFSTTSYVIGVPAKKDDAYVGFVFFIKSSNRLLIDYAWNMDFELAYKDQEYSPTSLDFLALLMYQNIKRVYNDSDIQLDDWFQENNTVLSGGYLGVDFCYDLIDENLFITNVELSLTNELPTRSEMPEGIAKSNDKVYNTDYGIMEFLPNVDIPCLTRLNLLSIENLNQLKKENIIMCNNQSFDSAIGNILNSNCDIESNSSTPELFNKVNLVIDMLTINEHLQEIGFINYDQNTFNGQSVEELGFAAGTLLLNIPYNELCQ